MHPKIGIILGTRPEIIKLMSVIRIFQERDLPFFILHTNQHYSHAMDQAFFDELHLPAPQYNLHVTPSTHGATTGEMLTKIEAILLTEQPTAVLVQGDTNTVLAGALAASKLQIAVGHIEAGLRSGDRTMPEEINRIVTDHVSDFLFAPTNVQRDALRAEGIPSEQIYVCGNTIVDAVSAAAELADETSQILDKHDLTPGDYILATLHRPATVDHPDHLACVLAAISKIAAQEKKTVILPLHPRTLKNITTHEIIVPPELHIIDPVGYLDMIKLQKDAHLIMTDSGGIQEEACILKKKCVILRSNTERPEALTVGGAILAGNTDTDEIVRASEVLLARDVHWHNPFGDGTTAQQIYDTLIQHHKHTTYKRNP